MAKPKKSHIPLMRTQNTGDNYRYRGTKETENGYVQREYESANYPGRADSLYIEGFAGESPDSVYKGQPGGWRGMNYFHEDDGSGK